MGQYAPLYLGNYPVVINKDDINPFLLSLFRRDEMRCFKRRVKDRRQLFYGRQDDWYERELALEFQSSAKVILDRLEILGYTEERAQYEFDKNRKAAIRLNYNLRRRKHFQDENIQAGFREAIKTLRTFSFSEFLSAAHEIIQLEYGFKDIPDETNNSPELIDYLTQYRYLGNFPHDDECCLLRTFLSIVPATTPITFDLTEIFNINEYRNADAFFDEYLGGSLDMEEKILILTEGSTDVKILKPSLELLYPHLAHFYSFMDFGVSHAQGSAGALTTTIKSFIGAGIKNKVIALFDNDSAAQSALRGLSKVPIPDNIKILRYPNTEFLASYPTIGPTGNVNMNINGLAGSIELYLGSDVLSNDDGLIPIHWTAYDNAIKQYQGEVFEKNKIQERFFAKVDRCRSDPDQISRHDWQQLEEILKVVFSAFSRQWRNQR